MISNTDAAYIAAFIDADGSISLNVREVEKGRDYYVLVQIANTDIEVLEWIQSLFGGTIHNKGTNKARGGKRDVFNLVYNGLKAKFILESILPYIRIKKTRCILALDFISEVERCRGRYKLTPADRWVRDDIADAIYLANKGYK